MRIYRALALSLCVALLAITVTACSSSDDGDEARAVTSAPEEPSTRAAVDIEGLATGRLVDREDDGLRLAQDESSDGYYDRVLVVGPGGSGEIEVVDASGQPYDSNLRAGLRVAVEFAPLCGESNPRQCGVERVVVLSEDDDPAVVNALDELTEPQPCGAAFWISNPEQTVSFELEYVAGSGQDAQAVLEHHTAELPSPGWRAVIVVGRDLFANWCTDLPADDHYREVVVEWPVVAGSIDVTWAWADPPTSGPATASVRVSGLEVQAPSGATIQLDDLVIDNACWMCAAG